MIYRILYVFLLPFICMKGQSALEEEPPNHGTPISSTMSPPDTPLTLEFESADLRPKSGVLPPPIPWTFEETAEWINELSVQKVWPSFFKALSTLPFCSYTPCAFTTVYGATLHTGQHTTIQITHAGLVMGVINNGTLLRALKASPNKAFGPLIKKLEAPVSRPLEDS